MKNTHLVTVVLLSLLFSACATAAQVAEPTATDEPNSTATDAPTNEPEPTNTPRPTAAPTQTEAPLPAAAEAGCLYLAQSEIPVEDRMVELGAWQNNLLSLNYAPSTMRLSPDGDYLATQFDIEGVKQTIATVDSTGYTNRILTSVQVDAGMADDIATWLPSGQMVWINEDGDLAFDDGTILTAAEPLTSIHYVDENYIIANGQTATGAFTANKFVLSLEFFGFQAAPLIDTLEFIGPYDDGILAVEETIDRGTSQSTVRLVLVDPLEGIQEEVSTFTYTIAPTELPWRNLRLVDGAPILYFQSAIVQGEEPNLWVSHNMFVDIPTGEIITGPDNVGQLVETSLSPNGRWMVFYTADEINIPEGSNTARYNRITFTPTNNLSSTLTKIRIDVLGWFGDNVILWTDSGVGIQPLPDGTPTLMGTAASPNRVTITDETVILGIGNERRVYDTNGQSLGTLTLPTGYTTLGQTVALGDGRFISLIYNKVIVSDNPDVPCDVQIALFRWEKR